MIQIKHMYFAVPSKHPLNFLTYKIFKIFPRKVQNTPGPELDKNNLKNKKFVHKPDLPHVRTQGKDFCCQFYKKKLDDW